MMLWRLARAAGQRLPAWEAPLKLSFALALVLLLLLLLLGFGGPPEIQLPARIGAFGCLITTQLLFLWANRRDISPYHQAQRHFIAGEYQAARAILEAIPEAGKASVDALVLLGNTYRQLGLFPQSRRALESALQRKPAHDLALFSAGKLHQVQGEYGVALDYFTRALAAGAPAIAQFELAHCHYLQGEYEKAAALLNGLPAMLETDAAQQLMAQYLWHCLGADESPPSQRIREYLPFWRAEAAKYQGTPYSVRLAEHVAQLTQLLDGA